jgi:putative transposase
MQKAIKVRLYPNASQRMALEAQFGMVRFVYNKSLAIINHYYKYHKKSLSAYHDVKKILPVAKNNTRYAFLKNADAQSLQQACINLDKAFKSFFNKKTGYPNFKRKQGYQKSYHPNATVCVTEGKRYGHVKVPKIKTPIKAVIHRNLPDSEQGELSSITLSKTPSGEYYASLLYVMSEELPEPKNTVSLSDIIGVDVGLNHLMITSKNKKYANPKYYVKSLKELRKAQRKLSRCKKGSHNRHKARIIVAKYHEKVRRKREDLLHKISTQLIHENQVVVVETLAVKNMLKNHKLARSISDASWSRFIEMLEYKAIFYGKRVIKVSQWFPSTKLCHVCQYKHPNMTQDIRDWICPDCKTHHDRDINAGINLQQQGVVELRAGGQVVLGSKAEIVELVSDANELTHSRNSDEARSLAR